MGCGSCPPSRTDGCRPRQDSHLRPGFRRPLLDAQRLAEGARYGDPILVRPRVGQGIFRIATTEAYGGACSVTGEHSLPALDAAHIRPYAQGGPHEVSNGLLLRADLHRLFDHGYLTVTPAHRVEVMIGRCQGGGRS